MRGLLLQKYLRKGDLTKINERYLLDSNAFKGDKLIYFHGRTAMLNRKGGNEKKCNISIREVNHRRWWIREDSIKTRIETAFTGLPDFTILDGLERIPLKQGLKPPYTHFAAHLEDGIREDSIKTRIETIYGPIPPTGHSWIREDSIKTRIETILIPVVAASSYRIREDSIKTRIETR